jgi:hypothetical protein
VQMCVKITSIENVLNIPTTEWMYVSNAQLRGSFSLESKSVGNLKLITLTFHDNFVHICYCQGNLRVYAILNNGSVGITGLFKV